jgi:hypothetical protein
MKIAKGVDFKARKIIQIGEKSADLNEISVSDDGQGTLVTSNDE